MFVTLPVSQTHLCTVTLLSNGNTHSQRPSQTHTYPGNSKDFSWEVTNVSDHEDKHARTPPHTLTGFCCFFFFFFFSLGCQPNSWQPTPTSQKAKKVYIFSSSPCAAAFLDWLRRALVCHRTHSYAGVLMQKLTLGA